MSDVSGNLDVTDVSSASPSFRKSKNHCKLASPRRQDNRSKSHQQKIDHEDNRTLNRRLGIGLCKWRLQATQGSINRLCFVSDTLLRFIRVSSPLTVLLVVQQPCHCPMFPWQTVLCPSTECAVSGDASTKATRQHPKVSRQSLRWWRSCSLKSKRPARELL